MRSYKGIMIELLNIDCMEYMATLPDKAFDLAVVDPPYGKACDIKTGGKEHTKSIVKFHQLYSKTNEWNDLPSKEYFDELFRISKNQIIWGGNYFELPPCRCFIVWDKIRLVENFSQVEMAWTSFSRPALLYSFCGNGGFILAPRDAKIHPTQKPISLYEWTLYKFAKPGQRILDTHLGSGSSAIAAHYFGCDFVGCEIDTDYFNAAKERFVRETRQVAMF